MHDPESKHQRIDPLSHPILVKERRLLPHSCWFGLPYLSESLRAPLVSKLLDCRRRVAANNAASRIMPNRLVPSTPFPLRAKIVLLAAEGLSNDVIATRLDTPRQIVSKWRKRFALARLPGLEAQPRGMPGRATTLSTGDIRCFSRDCVCGPCGRRPLVWRAVTLSDSTRAALFCFQQVPV